MGEPRVSRFNQPRVSYFLTGRKFFVCGGRVGGEKEKPGLGRIKKHASALKNLNHLTSKLGNKTSITLAYRGRSHNQAVSSIRHVELPELQSTMQSKGARAWQGEQVRGMLSFDFCARQGRPPLPRSSI